MSEEKQTAEFKMDVETFLKDLAKDITDLYTFRDLFFETHPIDKAPLKGEMVEEKLATVVKKFDDIDENTIPASSKAQYLYLKGWAYNVTTKYNPQATYCLSKAVKLNPRLVEAWNELGESYWKNMSIKEAKSSFEGALKHERNRVALRSLSVILRQESTNSPGDHQETILKSVDLAKEAVQQNIKDGTSWSILGNAYLCKYFTVAQETSTLKLCMSAYKQAALDPVVRNQPDIYYNSGVAYKYNEQYDLALENFDRACQLDPTWEIPRTNKMKLEEYLRKVNELVRTKGKMKTKKLTQMVQTIDKKMAGPYSESHNVVQLTDLCEGENSGCLALGRVLGSVLSDDMVPFTFALTDASMQCVVVTVYNWAQQAVIIGDTVALPAPTLTAHSSKDYNFKSIRVNNPTTLVVNGKKIGRSQFAGTRVTSTYEVY